MPTPARRAISSSEASMPRSANTEAATSTSRSRLRWASARSGLVSAAASSAMTASANFFSTDKIWGLEPGQASPHVINGGTSALSGVLSSYRQGTPYVTSFEPARQSGYPLETGEGRQHLALRAPCPPPPRHQFIPLSVKQ